ncbi:MAG: FmdB family zinc ribbon protein [Verrucomicrobiota bacterium]
MPLFEYKCKKCRTAFEALVSNADTKVACESCGSKQTEKQLSTFSASVASNSASPCSGGGCPSEGMAGSGCSTGTCPLS